MRRLFASVSIAAIACAMPASAQEAAGAADGEVVEIIVTARRIEERLQDVPASISVFTEAALDAAGVKDTEDFVRLTPGVTIVTGTAEVGDTQINIRGINGARDAEPSVALVVDGILKTNTAALNANQGDVTQVEILKGPQGALYGRNAAAGAIVLSTRKPGDALEGRVTASAAEDDSYSGFASVSTPLSDTAGLLLSADWRRTDGQYRITAPTPSSAGRYMDRYEGFNLNGRLMFEAGESANVDLKAKYGKVDAGSIVFNSVFALPNFAALNPAFYSNVNDHVFTFQPNIAPDNNQRTIEASGKVDYELASGTRLTAWLAYSDVNQNLLADGTSGAFGFFNAEPTCRATTAQLSAAGVRLPAPQFLGAVPDSNLFVPNGSLFGAYTPTTCDGTQYQVRNQDDLSAEVRLAGESGGVRWLAGAYGLDLNREVGVNLGIDRGQGVIRQLFVTDAANRTEQLVHDKFDTRVFALFGSVDADLSDTVVASLAVRYDNERRRVTNLVSPTARTQFVDFNGVPFTGNAPLNAGLLTGPILPQKRTFDQFQPKASLTWKPSGDLSLFANYGRGFKSGGFNNQGSRATINLNFNSAPISAGIDIRDTFESETSDAFEAGFKAQALDGALSIEGAGYVTRVKNMQFFEFFVGTFGLLRVVSNIDKVDIKGAELAASVRPVKGWTLFASGNVTDSEIKRNRARPDSVGNESPYTSDYTLNAGTQLDLPVTDNVEFNLRADLRLTGPTWFSTVQNQPRPTLFTAILPLAGLPAALGTARYDRAEREKFTTVNLRGGFSGESWSLTAFATNLFDKAYLDEVIPAAEFGGSFISPGQRRQIGVEFGYKF